MNLWTHFFECAICQGMPWLFLQRMMTYLNLSNPRLLPLEPPWPSPSLTPSCQLPTTITRLWRSSKVSYLEVMYVALWLTHLIAWDYVHWPAVWQKWILIWSPMLAVSCQLTRNYCVKCLSCHVRRNSVNVANCTYQEFISFQFTRNDSWAGNNLGGRSRHGTWLQQW